MWPDLELIGVYPSRFSVVFFTSKGVFPFSYERGNQQNIVVQCFIKLWPYLQGGLKAKRSRLLGKSRYSRSDQNRHERGTRATPPPPAAMIVLTDSLTRKTKN